MAVLLWGMSVVVGCRPQAPDVTRLPRVEVPFTGITDGRNEAATPVPEPEDQAGATPQVVPDLPDPKPGRYEHFFDYELEFNQGNISVLSASPRTTQHPTFVDRRMGRFAFELFVGDHLLERVRFDFPLLGATTNDEPDDFEAGLTSRSTVVIPSHERATWARILDRKTRKTHPVDWPPGAGSSTGGTSGQ